jgi:four helix bundle protein
MDLAVKIYELCKSFPKEETYGLSSQMKRAAVSIPSNIAEGFKRIHRPEQRQFAMVAYGSGAELETQILLAKRIGLITEEAAERVDAILNEVMRMLNAYTAART